MSVYDITVEPVLEILLWNCSNNIFKKKDYKVQCQFKLTMNTESNESSLLINVTLILYTITTFSTFLH